MHTGPFDRPGWQPDGPWQDDERSELAWAWRRGETLQEIGERHGRTARSVVQQLHRQGEIDDARKLGLLHEIEGRRGMTASPRYDLAA
jgi:hypothetical protein